MKLFSLLLVSGLLAIGLATQWWSAPNSTDPEEKTAIAALEFHLSGIVPSAMAQSHQMLIDKHSAAGVTCETCHGGAAFTEPVAEATCTQCHGTYSELAAKTPWEPNPHQSHMGELACSTCHNVHKPSVSFCDQCHSFGMQVP